MASQSKTEEIVALLREGVAAAEIALRLDVSPPVVWGVKCHWRLGRYGDSFAGESSMTDEGLVDDGSLISALAEGVDPFTGEVLAREHLLQQPQVVRALFHAAHALERQGKSAKRAAALPTNAGAAWSEEEDLMLAHEFDFSIPVPEIAKRHGRTKGAITSRLVRLGKIGK